ncbi:MAG: hypothetical protein QXS41_03355 [Candidatus Woesearchaeota archaeon]
MKKRLFVEIILILFIFALFNSVLACNYEYRSGSGTIKIQNIYVTNPEINRLIVKKISDSNYNIYTNSYTNQIHELYIQLTPDSNFEPDPNEFNIKKGSDNSVLSISSKTIVADKLIRLSNIPLSSESVIYLYYKDQCMIQFNNNLDTSVDPVYIAGFYYDDVSNLYVNFSSNDPSGISIVRLQIGSNYYSPVSFNSLGSNIYEGVYNYQIPPGISEDVNVKISEIKDGIGNLASSSASFLLSVDKKAPEIKQVIVKYNGNSIIRLREGSGTVNLNVQIKFDERSLPLNVTLKSGELILNKADCGTFCTFDLPYDLTGKSNGNYSETIFIDAYDDKGNGPTSRDHTFNVEILELLADIVSLKAEGRDVSCILYRNKSGIIYLNDSCEFSPGDFLTFNNLNIQPNYVKLRGYSTEGESRTFATLDNTNYFAIKLNSAVEYTKNAVDVTLEDSSTSKRITKTLFAAFSNQGRNRDIFSNGFFSIEKIVLDMKYNYAGTTYEFKRVITNKSQDVYIWKDMNIAIEVFGKGTCLLNSNFYMKDLAGITTNVNDRRLLEFTRDGEKFSSSFNFDKTSYGGTFYPKAYIEGDCGNVEIPALLRFSIVTFKEEYLRKPEIKNVTLKIRKGSMFKNISEVAIPDVNLSDNPIPLNLSFKINSTNAPIQILVKSIIGYNITEYDLIECTNNCENFEHSLNVYFNPADLKDLSDKKIKIVIEAYDKFGNKNSGEYDFRVNLGNEYYIIDILDGSNTHSCGKYVLLNNGLAGFLKNDGLILLNKSCLYNEGNFFNFTAVLPDLSYFGIDLSIKNYTTNGTTYVSSNNFVQIYVNNLSNLQNNYVNVSITDSLGNVVNQTVYLLESKVNDISSIYNTSYFAINDIYVKVEEEYGSLDDEFVIRSINELSTPISMWNGTRLSIYVNATGRCLEFSRLKINFSSLKLQNQDPIEGVRSIASSFINSIYGFNFINILVSKNTNENVILKLKIEGLCGDYEFDILNISLRILNDTLDSRYVSLDENSIKLIPPFYVTTSTYVVGNESEIFSRNNLGILFQLNKSQDSPAGLRVRKISIDPSTCAVYNVRKESSFYLRSQNPINNIRINFVKPYFRAMLFNDNKAQNILNLDVSNTGAVESSFMISCNVSFYFEDEVNIYKNPLTFEIVPLNRPDYRFDVSSGADYKTALFKKIEKTWYNIKNSNINQWWYNIFLTLYGLHTAFVAIGEAGLHLTMTCYSLRAAGHVANAIMPGSGNIFHLSADFINLLANPMIVFYELYQSTIGSFITTIVHPYGPLYGFAKFKKMHDTLESIPVFNLRYNEYKNLIPFASLFESVKKSGNSNSQSKECDISQPMDCFIQLDLTSLNLQLSKIINNPSWEEILSLGQKFFNNAFLIYYVILRETYLEPYSNTYAALTFFSLPAIFFVIPHKQYQYDCEYLKCLIDAYNLRAEPSYCEDILTIKNARYPDYFSIGSYFLGGLLAQLVLPFLFSPIISFFDFEDNYILDDFVSYSILFLFDIFDSGSIRKNVLSTTFNLQDDLSKYLYETYYRGYVVNDNGVYKINASGYLISLVGGEILGNILFYLLIDLGKQHFISWASSSLGSWVDSWSLYDSSDKCNVIGLFIKFIIDEILRWLLAYSFSISVAYFTEASSSATSTYSAPYYSVQPVYKFNFEPVVRTFFEGCLMKTVTNQLLSSIGGSCGKSTWDPVSFLIFYNYYFFGKDISSPNNETALKIYSRQAKLLINLLVGSGLKSLYSLIPSSSEDRKLCDFTSMLENLKDYLHLGSYAEFAMSYRRKISELCSLLAKALGSSGKDIKEMFELLVGFEVPCDEYINYCEPITTCDSWEKFKKEVLFQSSKDYRYGCSTS